MSMGVHGQLALLATVLGLLIGGALVFLAGYYAGAYVSRQGWLRRDQR